MADYAQDAHTSSVLQITVVRTRVRLELLLSPATPGPPQGGLQVRPGRVRLAAWVGPSSLGPEVPDFPSTKPTSRMRWLGGQGASEETVVPRRTTSRAAAPLPVEYVAEESARYLDHQLCTVARVLATSTRATVGESAQNLDHFSDHLVGWLAAKACHQSHTASLALHIEGSKVGALGPSSYMDPHVPFATVTSNASLLGVPATRSGYRPVKQPKQ